MRNTTSYFIGDKKECQALIDFLEHMQITYTVYGISEHLDGVKFWNPFLTHTQYKNAESCY